MAMYTQAQLKDLNKKWKKAFRKLKKANKKEIDNYERELLKNAREYLDRAASV